MEASIQLIPDTSPILTRRNGRRRDLQWLPQGHITKRVRPQGRAHTPSVWSAFSAAAFVGARSCILKSGGLTHTLCHLFSSQATSLRREGCMCSLGWEGRSGYGVWSDSYGAETLCWPPEAWRCLSAGSRMGRFPFHVQSPNPQEPWPQAPGKVSWVPFPLSLCLWHVISASQLPARL